MSEQEGQRLLTVDEDAVNEVMVHGTILLVPDGAGWNAVALVRAVEQLLVLWVCDMPEGTMLTNAWPRWPVCFETREEAVQVASVCLRGAKTGEVLNGSE